MNKIICCVGRRKKSIARVILTKGVGNIIINNKNIENFFPSKLFINNLKQPIIKTNNENKFNFNVNVYGGGFSGQTEAIRLGIARTLVKYNIENKHILKISGLLTRDARIKERKKYGLKAARKASQFSKR